MARKGIRELEGGYEDERSAKSEEQVAWNVRIKRQLSSKGQQEGANGKQNGAHDAANSRAVSIEDCAHRKGADIRSNGGSGEHEIEPVSTHTLACVRRDLRCPLHVLAYRISCS